MLNEYKIIYKETDYESEFSPQKLIIVSGRTASDCVARLANGKQNFLLIDIVRL